MNTNTYSPSVVIVNNLGQDIQDARREENRLASWWTGKKKKKKRPSPFQGQKILLAALEQMRVGRETHPPRSDSQVNDIHSFVQEIWVEFLLSLVAQLVKKNLPAMQQRQVRFLDQEDPLEKEMATHSSTLAWRIPQTEELGGLQTMGTQESDTT